MEMTHTSKSGPLSDLRVPRSSRAQKTSSVHLGEEIDIVDDQCPAVRFLHEAGRGLLGIRKAPRSEPKSVYSTSVSGIAANLISTIGPWARGLCRWSQRVSAVLPERTSPSMRRYGGQESRGPDCNSRMTWRAASTCGPVREETLD
jgi:hypothetical protein